MEIIAEQFADVLGVALDTTDNLPAYGWESAEWKRYAIEALATSPVLRPTKKSLSPGTSEADEGTRTLDLLHGKQTL